MRHNIKMVLLGAAALVALSGAVAGASALITSANIKNGTIRGRDIHKNTISASRLTPGVRKQLSRVGKQGPAGKNGVNGSNSSNSSNGAPGASGAPGRDGAPGQNGKDGANGLNPATPVLKDGDAGFKLSGTPAATFQGGALHLHGGFDSSTPQGAPGLAHAYDNVPLSSLTTLGYAFSKNLSGGSDQPTIHVSVTGATGTDSKFPNGFTNLVYNPVYNGMGTTRDATVDTIAAGNRWYSTGADATGAATGGQSAPITIQQFQQRNPDAVVVQIAIDNGGSSSGTTSADATDFSVDDLTIGFGSGFTRYDLGG